MTMSDDGGEKAMEHTARAFCRATREKQLSCTWSRGVHWLRRLSTAAVLLVSLGMVSGCGGGSASDAMPREAPAATTAKALQAEASWRQLEASWLRAADQRSGVRRAALAVRPELPAAVEALMAFGEKTFPEYFPGPAITQRSGPFLFRHYPSTGTYLGVVVEGGTSFVLEGVYVAGGPFGAAPALVGHLDKLLDYDGDGTPNAQDGAPLDALCFEASDADENGRCLLRLLADPSASLVAQAGSVLYLHTGGAVHRLMAYDVSKGRFVAHLRLTDIQATAFAFVPDHQRLYVGDDQGRIHALSATLDRAAGPWAQKAAAIRSLAMAGRYLLAQDDELVATVFDRNAIRTATVPSEPDGFRHTVWSPVESRLYSFAEDRNPPELEYRVVQQTTGQVTRTDVAPFLSSNFFAPPLRMNATATKLLTGFGDIYAVPSFLWTGQVPVNLPPFIGALWLPQDELLVATANGELNRFNDRGKLILSQRWPATHRVMALALHESDAYVLSRLSTHLEIRKIVLSNDIDGDGVTNPQDDFPLDPAASRDSDGDGHPDRWNDGRNQTDSTQGLTLDAYPQDPTCHAVQQGNGVECDPRLHIPLDDPSLVFTDGSGVVYLQTPSELKLYRWSAQRGRFIAPFVVGQMGELGRLEPPTVAVAAPAHGVIYLGYETGLITSIEMRDGARERPFAQWAPGVNHLQVAGDFLVARSVEPFGSASASTVAIINRRGEITDRQTGPTVPLDAAWSAAQRRLYYLPAIESDHIAFDVISTSGKLTSRGRSPSVAGRRFSGGLLISEDGSRLAVGSGQIVSTSTLQGIDQIAVENRQGLSWLPDGRLAVITRDDLDTRVSVMGGNPLAVQKEFQLTGEPLSMSSLGSGGLGVLTRREDGSYAMIRLDP